MHLSTAKLIEKEEGYRHSPYYCSEGYPTVGIGKRIGQKGTSLDLYQFTVPYNTALTWLSDDIDVLFTMLEYKFDWFELLNQARKDIIVSMCYQMGFDGFCKFEKTIKLLSESRFMEASQEMLDSIWCRKTPLRAHRHSKVIAIGDYDACELYSDID